MKLIVLVVFLVGLIAPCLCRMPILDFNYYVNTYNSPAQPFVGDYDIIERFFPQAVDHFNLSDTRNFLQRYLSIENYYQIGGPVFIFIGGFEPFDGGVHFNYTFARDLAIEHGGMVYAIENRFFGLSRPTFDLSLDSLRLLTIEQSLRDYAVLIQFIKDYVALANSFRIFIGGTNSGATLATWIAQSYPDLATGTWASSAPLETSLEFANYFNDIGNTLNRIDSDCYARIEEAFVEMDEIFANGTTEILDNLFNLEYPINIEDERDKQTFFSVMSLYFAEIVEFQDEAAIVNVCDIVIENQQLSALEAFAIFVQAVYEEMYPDISINVRYESMINAYRETSWDSPAALGGRQILYIACSQFSLFPTTRVQPTPFGDHISISFYTQMCRDLYSDEFTDEFIATQNTYTNVRYNGKTPHALYVFFTNGGNDPFRLYGLEEDLNIYSPTVVIPNYGKSRDFFTETYADSMELIAARQTLNQLIQSRP